MRLPVILLWICFLAALPVLPAVAQDKATPAAPVQTQAKKPCAATEKSCLLAELGSITDTVTDTLWRDQTYRESAKLMTREKMTGEAIALLNKIQNPDTKALTIRGIGMAAAAVKNNMAKGELDALWVTLHREADKIDHPPSHAIALTYIAMAQAFAGDDKGAHDTAMGMDNTALRHKALGETANIQAERGDVTQALASIASIDDPSFRDKALRKVSRTFAEHGKYDEALQTARAIDNAYQKAQAVLFILARQITPDEVSVVE